MGIEQAIGLKVDLAVNPQSKAWLFYNNHLTSPIEWMEYDLKHNKITIVTDEGKIRDLAVDITPSMQKHLSLSRKINTIRVDDNDGVMKDLHIVPIIVRDLLTD